MKTNVFRFLLSRSPAWIACLAALLLPASVGADVTQAEDIAYRMAVSYTQQGFAMTPTQTGTVGNGQILTFNVNVSKSIDYVFLIGSDANIRKAEVFVYDEVGNLIRDDRRLGNEGRAGVRFRSPYNGQAKVYVWARFVSGLGSWSALVGRRGAERKTNDDAVPLSPTTLPNSPEK